MRTLMAAANVKVSVLEMRFFVQPLPFKAKCLKLVPSTFLRFYRFKGNRGNV